MNSFTELLFWYRENDRKKETVVTIDESGNGENSLSSTQWLRQLLSNNESQKEPLHPLGKNDNCYKVFRDNVHGLLYGIDKCAGNLAQWSDSDTSFFYKKFMHLLTWKRHALDESNHDVFANRLSLLTSVYRESLKFMTFSAAQKQNIDSKIKELNDVVIAVKIENHGLNEAMKQAEEYREELRILKDVYKKLTELMLTNPLTQVNLGTRTPCLEGNEKQLTELKKKEVNEKKADEYREEPRKVQDSLYKVHFKLNESSLATELKNKEHELECRNELRKLRWVYLKLNDLMEDKEKQLSELKKLVQGTKKQNKTESELTETQKQFQSFIEQSREMTKIKQKDINRKLTEIQTSLLMKNPHYKPSFFNNCIHLNKEERIFEEIKSIIEYERNLAESNSKQNTTKSALETNSSFLKVTEHEELKKQLDWAAKKQKEAEGELKKQLDWAARKQKETEGKLAETREQLQSFVSKSREMTQTKQKEMNRKLYEIETSLLMKNPNYRPSCQVENESLNKEDKLFKSIKAIMEYESNSAKSDSNREQSTTESVLETNSSSSLRVSEYEVHLVTLISAFLKITPYPVSSQDIYSYVAKIDNVVDLQFVESLMRKFPSFFKEVAGEPGSGNKNWIYLDLKPVITL